MLIEDCGMEEDFKRVEVVYSTTSNDPNALFAGTDNQVSDSDITFAQILDTYEADLAAVAAVPDSVTYIPPTPLPADIIGGDSSDDVAGTVCSSELEEIGEDAYDIY